MQLHDLGPLGGEIDGRDLTVSGAHNRVVSEKNRQRFVDEIIEVGRVDDVEAAVLNDVGEVKITPARKGRFNFSFDVTRSPKVELLLKATHKLFESLFLNY